MTTPIYSH